MQLKNYDEKITILKKKTTVKKKPTVKNKNEDLSYCCYVPRQGNKIHLFVFVCFYGITH